MSYYLKKPFFSLGVLLYTIFFIGISFLMPSFLIVGLLGIGLLILMVLLWGVRGGAWSILLASSMVTLLFLRKEMHDLSFVSALFGMLAYLVILFMTLALRDAVNKLKSSEEKYRNLVERASDGIIIIQDGIIKYANQVLMPVLGYRVEEVLGTEFTKYIEKKDLPKVADFYKRRMKGENIPSVYEATLKHKSGGPVFVEFSAGIIDYQGRTADLVIVRDITHRKQIEGVLHQKEQEFKILVETAPDIIARFDEEYRFVYVNPTVEKEWGILRKDFFWKKIDEMNFPSEISRLWENAIKDVFIEKKEKLVYSEYGTGNGLKYYYTRFFPELDKSGRVRTVLGISRDITEVKEIDKVKSEFISVSSHQLRTPLSIIRWCAMAMLSGEMGRMNKDQKDYTNRIYLSSKRLIKLTNAFLNVAILDLGALSVNPRTSDFRKICEESLKEFKGEIEEKKIKVVKKFQKNIPKVKVDPKLLKIIFRALFSNAFKYSYEEGNVMIEVKTEDKSILAKISDDGHGIPEDQQPGIFSKFFRADNAKVAESYGTGLDLYIVKSIIKNSSGKIWFESPNPEISSSKLKKGAIFYFTLPLRGMAKKKGEMGF